MIPLEHRFTYEGRSVAWGRVGTGAPLVLIHGFPWSAQAWRRVVPWLAPHRTVYVFDMIGCGQSDKGPGISVAPEVQSRLLAALVKHWELDAPEVAGHDFGGLAALRGYFMEGLRYSRLTLFDAVAVLPSGSSFFAHVREHEAAFAGLPPYAHAALFQAYIGAAAHRPLSDEARATYLAPWHGRTGQAAFYRQIAQANETAIATVQDRYRSLDCPVHLVWGAHDTFIPVTQGEDLRNRLTANDLTVVPHAGHALQEDAPEAMVAALLRPAA
ncbi:alpha/beta hydrolase [Roseospira marina]|uniref:Alpha/beta hydrolase n=1 Tax=Roseospira marina TaxID=140057 RepID=A0A5M6IGE0_9PROT|nr:alpha/beta hydrolase [Roseospira marina]KAA5607284.1 alpha/beta hydrolase [Roseospira marina]MBB4312561.1 pimeloyl-ACP methyl ester carboxylesterase [Roseospira marina]MBB5085423.1 pimeloyl-ACP methyl ester carboxylesterase [Roseospira marina]